ncbi:MAG: nucleotide exchange factor GrpE, partial [Clostridiales bacterium]|nr:nucleotide exchange factor GrpE [Clostridiales bacterium]
MAFNWFFAVGRTRKPVFKKSDAKPEIKLVMPPEEKTAKEQREKQEKALADLSKSVRRVGGQTTQANISLEELGDTMKIVAAQAQGAKEREVRVLVDAMIFAADYMEDFYVFAKDSGDPSLFEQAELIWNSTLKRFSMVGLTRINNERTFPDPLYEHIVGVEVPETYAREGVVIQTLKSGYIYKEKVVRKADVIVAGKTERHSIVIPTIDMEEDLPEDQDADESELVTSGEMAASLDKGPGPDAKKEPEIKKEAEAKREPEIKKEPESKKPETKKEPEIKNKDKGSVLFDFRTGKIADLPDLVDYAEEYEQEEREGFLDDDEEPDPSELAEIEEELKYAERYAKEHPGEILHFGDFDEDDDEDEEAADLEDELLDLQYFDDFDEIDADIEIDKPKTGSKNTFELLEPSQDGKDDLARLLADEGDDESQFLLEESLQLGELESEDWIRSAHKEDDEEAAALELEEVDPEDEMVDFNEVEQISALEELLDGDLDPEALLEADRLILSAMDNSVLEDAAATEELVESQVELLDIFKEESTKEEQDQDSFDVLQEIDQALKKTVHWLFDDE